jgi:hypothetical protein
VDRDGREGCSDLVTRWRRASDRERVLFLFWIGIFFCGAGTCVWLSRLTESHSLAHALGKSGFWVSLVFFNLPGLLVLSGAAAMYLKRRNQADYRKQRIQANYRRRRRQADPDRRARQSEFLRLRQEGSLVSQPDLARELGVKSPTVRRWCQELRLEPAHRVGRNYYTSKQADLIRRYGIASTTERREIRKELIDQASNCTACGAWNPPASQQCDECGAALEGGEV